MRSQDLKVPVRERSLFTFPIHAKPRAPLRDKGGLLRLHQSGRPNPARRHSSDVRCRLRARYGHSGRSRMAPLSLLARPSWRSRRRVASLRSWVFSVFRFKFELQLVKRYCRLISSHASPPLGRAHVRCTRGMHAASGADNSKCPPTHRTRIRHRARQTHHTTGNHRHRRSRPDGRRFLPASTGAA